MTTSPTAGAPVDVAPPPAHLEGYEPSEGRGSVAEPLIGVVQDLSLARDLSTIMGIVRKAARELTGADGASFILRDGGLCYYAEEDSIAPLWKGRRFPMSACVSGWVMLHGEGVAIEDIYADPRIPVEAYRPTFVKSLAMVPIRTKAPIGAIGNYWASRHRATPEQLLLLQALADSTSVAMENVEVYAELEERVRRRTHELEATHQRLRAEHDALVELQRQKEVLSALVVHDLKSPATAISLSASLRLQAADLPAADRRCWSSVLSSAEHIHRTALNLLDIAGSDDGRLRPKPAAIDVGALLAEIRELFASHAERRAQTIEPRSDVPPGALRADPDLLRRVLQNLVDNALRHSPVQSTLRIQARASAEGVEIAVCDEGPGVPHQARHRIFDRYVQLGEGDDQADTNRGLGLAFCRLAVEAHGGTIWIEDNEPRGSRFCFRLPIAPS
jgi:signal transduction histidine kinase